MHNTFHGPLKLEAHYTDALNITSDTFGGEFNIKLNKALVTVELNDVDMKKVDYLISKDVLFSKGVLNANATYHIKDKAGKSDLILKDSILNGVNIDEKISTLNDVLGLNIINMSKSLISNFSDAQQSQTTIEHMQFDTTFKNKNIKLDDVALRTKKFLIVALGDLKDNGDINSLGISIVDKNGCAIITQALSGNIKDPKTAQTTSTIVNIVERVPKSILKTGRKILNFGTETIDDVASFGVQNILRTDRNVSIASDVVSESSSLIDSTSNIIVPKGCKVIYDGKVKHPKKIKNK